MTGSPANQYEVGGLSGVPLKQYSLATLRTLRGLLPATIPIFGCGGISSGADALEYARAGATAVQLYTSFGFEGVGVPRRVKDELVEALRKEGTTWAEVVKKAVAEKISTKERLQFTKEDWNFDHLSYNDKGLLRELLKDAMVAGRAWEDARSRRSSTRTAANRQA